MKLRVPEKNNSQLSSRPPTDPKIVMTLLVRDEKDILADQINFHIAQGVDHFIITDNLSEDETPNIIEHFCSTGIATSIFEPRDDYSQSKWVTRMARLAAIELQADWIINSDADEFWMTPNGSLKEIFSQIKDEIDLVEVPRHDFACLESKSGAWHHDMIYRKAISKNPLGDPLPPKVAHRAHPDIVVHQGNHSISGVTGNVEKNSGLEIFHFPLRSIEQYENKIRKGGAAYQRNTELPVNTGLTWRKLYDQISERGSLDLFFGDNIFSEAELLKGIEDETLIRDTRLQDFFSNDP